MAQYYTIHTTHPQKRIICKTAQVVRDGGIIIYPTDSAYGLGCHVGNKEALERIRAIRNLDKNHHFTLMCRDLSEISTYAFFNTPTYRLLKHCTPGPYTFILKASKEVPRRLMHPKKKTIGVRIPDHVVAQGILEELGTPMLYTTLLLPGMELPMNDPEEMLQELGKQVDLLLDGGPGDIFLTTVVGLLDDIPEIIREGKGSLDPFL